MKLTIALAQTDPVPCDLRGNIGTHVDYAQKAAQGGADLVVFPELSLTGYTLRDAAQEMSLNDDTQRDMKELLDVSREIAILAGGVEESADFGLYNAAFLFSGGSVRCVHRKIYLPTYGMFEEHRYFLPGSRVMPFIMGGISMGALICEDLWHLSVPYLLAAGGAQVIVALSASPTRLAGETESLRIAEINAEQHRTFARLLSAYVVFSNRVGYEDGVNFWGGSSVISPSGETVVRAALFEKDMVFATVDTGEVRRARRRSRHYLDEDLHLTIRELRRITHDPSKRRDTPDEPDVSEPPGER